jgi:hypothetical protein
MLFYELWKMIQVPSFKKLLGTPQIIGKNFIPLLEFLISRGV